MTHLKINLHIIYSWNFLPDFFNISESSLKTKKHEKINHLMIMF